MMGISSLPMAGTILAVLEKGPCKGRIPEGWLPLEAIAKENPQAGCRTRGGAENTIFSYLLESLGFP